jgi:hypothetical protein
MGPVRSRRAERLSRAYLQDGLSGFVAYRSLLLEPSAEWLLRGFLYESSGHTGDDFYMWAFVQPLYVPQKDVTLDYGKRLGGSSRFWSLSEGPDEATVMGEVLGAMKGEGLRFLEALQSPAHLARAALGRLIPEDVNTREVAAYSLILSGDREQARSLLKQMDVGREADEPVWTGEARARGHRILALLDEEAEVVVDQLRAWRDETVAALGIDPFASAAGTPPSRNSDPIGQKRRAGAHWWASRQRDGR